MRKKKIVVSSNSSSAKTGFGKHLRVLLTYLYKTGKYDLVEYRQGIPWSHPANSLTPWKSFGCLPDDPRELEPFQNNPALMSAIQYGDYYLDRVIQEEKPDVFISVEDIWGVPALNKAWWNKITCVNWTPIDSTPLHNMFFQTPGLFENLWVKAIFAQEELTKLGIKSDFYPALIDHKPFQQLNLEEKLDLRRKHGISDDTLVFGFVFRNQYRKLIAPLMEALKKFKDETGKKAKLWIHTDWSEGWPLEQFISEYGLDRDDILSTHICNKCKNVSVRPFFGHKLPCFNCHRQDTVNTVSVDCGPEDDGMSNLYNLCDGYIHPANSGGFEMPILEALFCGLPTATLAYSYGSNFVRNPDVFQIDYQLMRDFHMNYWNKAVPFVDSIVDFMNHIDSLSKEKRFEIGKKLRKWAIEEFDSEKICKRVEDFLDKAPFTDYDFEFSPEKNDKYPMPQIEDEREFVIDLFKNILKVDIRNNQEELNKALEGFKMGFTKEMVYQKFIEMAISENQKLKKINLKDLLADDGKRKIIVVMNGTPEQCLVELPFLEKLKQDYDQNNWSFYLAINADNLPIFNHLAEYKIIPLAPFMENPDNLKKEGLFDVVVNPISIRKNSF